MRRESVIVTPEGRRVSMVHSPDFLRRLVKLREKRGEGVPGESVVRLPRRPMASR